MSAETETPKQVTAFRVPYELHQLLSEFFALLDIKEETDSGREFRPNIISSVRAADSLEMSRVLDGLKRWTKNPNWVSNTNWTLNPDWKDATHEVLLPAPVSPVDTGPEPTPDFGGDDPTFDPDGYPTMRTLDLIAIWPVSDLKGWLDFCCSAFNTNYGMWEVVPEADELRIATGGWSGNESVIYAMRCHHVFWVLLWKSSHRGGLDILDLSRCFDPDPQLKLPLIY